MSFFAAILSTSEMVLTKRVLHLCRIFRVDCRANVAQRAAKTRAQLTVVFATLDVLAMRFER